MSEYNRRLSKLVQGRLIAQEYSRLPVAWSTAKVLMEAEAAIYTREGAHCIDSRRVSDWPTAGASLRQRRLAAADIGWIP